MGYMLSISDNSGYWSCCRNALDQLILYEIKMEFIPVRILSGGGHNAL
jgi:hypothetical protein